MIISCIDSTLLSDLTLGSNKKVICRCDGMNCQKEWETSYFHVSKKITHFCRSCAMSNVKKGSQLSVTHKQNISKGVKNPYCLKQDKKKLEQVLLTGIKLIIITRDDLTTLNLI